MTKDQEKAQVTEIKSQVPKHLYTLLKSLANQDQTARVSNNEVGMLRARSRTYKNKNISIGNTNFSFDTDGNMEVPNLGNARLDFDLLCARVGIEEVKELETDLPTLVKEVTELANKVLAKQQKVNKKVK